MKLLRVFSFLEEGNLLRNLSHLDEEGNGNLTVYFFELYKNET